LIPLLHAAGVYTIGMEFGASEDQAALDALVTAGQYDEDLARRLMFNYNVGWSFVEYMNIYRRAWTFNRSLPAGARPLRVLNLSYRYNWSGYNGVRTPYNVAQVFHRGPVDRYRADVVRREILDRSEKILILTGTIHAFTRYTMPVFDYNAAAFCRLDDRHLGNLLHQAAPGKAATILLHQPFWGKRGGPAELVLPANGAIDQVMAALGHPRVGFDVCGAVFGDLHDDSYYATGRDDFRLGDLTDGYVYDRPFDRFEGCTVDEQFLTAQNWPAAQEQFPDPDMHPRPTSLEEYRQRIRHFADIQARYRNLI
jgi:hypothetical protein